jgi:hypothetical protein
MPRSLSRAARPVLVSCLALALLAGSVGDVGAADNFATPAAIARLNTTFSRLASLEVSTPIQIALWEADAIACLTNFVPMSTDQKAADGMSQAPELVCADRVVPSGLFPIITIVYVSRLVLQGPWATIDTVGGQGMHPGSIIIDSNNTGKLISNQPGYAAINFYREFGTNFGVPGEEVVSFTYNHVDGSGAADDRGYGLLIETDDGCKMYGRFYSTNDPTTLGSLFLARC